MSKPADSNYGSSWSIPTSVDTSMPTSYGSSWSIPTSVDTSMPTSHGSSWSIPTSVDTSMPTSYGSSWSIPTSVDTSMPTSYGSSWSIPTSVDTSMPTSYGSSWSMPISVDTSTLPSVVDDNVINRESDFVKNKAVKKAKASVRDAIKHPLKKSIEQVISSQTKTYIGEEVVEFLGAAGDIASYKIDDCMNKIEAMLAGGEKR